MTSTLLSLTWILSLIFTVGNALPLIGDSATHVESGSLAGPLESRASSCFPALGFRMPSSVPSNINNWWCDPSTEYAFLGFSYEITACQSQSQLNKEFSDIRINLNGRYVRLYGSCDKDGYYDKVVEAAWENGLGVHALIWFGFDSGNQWKTRRNKLFASLHSNPKAKFVTRGVQFGSEPLYDGVLPHAQLANQVKQAKANLSSLGIPVTVSELAYGYQEHGGAQDVLDAVDFINIHALPFFDHKASTANMAWPIVENTINFFSKNGDGKKMYLDENGWPSKAFDGVQPNSPSAVANVANEKAYFDLLDSKCSYFKAATGGGIGWFAHVYSEDQEPGYGIYGSNGKLKFAFKPRTSC
ncbi:hypothetical protein FOMPIDRAFT_114078 [Fomitopsis schrenkii]|uniref:glucan endo-1,3-beta-D-glucosidase n=1 Tax=Fomitopsis schrenkii TaxID=2126942 RepID=S8FMT8_FOMSC|nr:hypothetical protein FOMPIDRAFT_114078 [Fomitopsis schrenkii]